MQRLKKMFVVFLLTGFVFILTRNAFAKTILGDFLKDRGIDLEVDISSSVDFYNKYVWRGFLLDNDPVIQPSVTVSALGFEGGFWGSWDLSGEDELASDEVDGWLGYSFDLGFIDEALAIISFSAGNTWYGFPEADGYTVESYVGISIDTLLAPYFTWYHDYGDEDQGGADGNYYMIGVGHSVDVIEEYGVTLDLGSEVGFNNEAFIEGDGGYYMFTLGVTVPLTEVFTMNPNMGWVIPFGDLEDASDGAQDNEFYVGVAMSAAM